MPLQVRADEPMRLLRLGMRGLGGMTVGQKPHVMEGFRVHLRSSRRAALVARGPAPVSYTHLTLPTILLV